MNVQGGYEILEHTADKGVRAWGRTLEEMIENASRGMYRLVIDPTGKKADRVFRVEVRVESATDEADLLVAWLRELIYLTDVHKVVFLDFHVDHVDDECVEGEAYGITVENNEMLDGAPVKAVTYHRLRVEHKPDGWEAEFYVDV